MGIFQSKPVQFEAVPTDAVIPLHSKDDTQINRAMVLDLTLRFDDVLDPSKLRNSLARLLEIGHWRKLGARLRLNKSGKLEYHIPTIFDEKRPPFIYSHAQYQMSIAEHPLASRIPKTALQPTLFPDPAIFQPLARDQSTPTKIEDWIYSDKPQLSLHVVSFTDATLVSLTWPHTYFDAMGRAALFNAWIAVLEGREEDVPDLIGYDYDPLENISSIQGSKEEPYILAKHQMKGLRLVMFIFNYMFELLWHRKESTRTICIPASTLSQLKSDALVELASAPENKGKSPFLTDGDILTALWARLAALHLPPSNNLIAVANAFGLRSILSSSLLPKEKAYISNAVFAVYALVPLNQLINKPLSWTAYQVRKSIVEQGTLSQVQALDRIQAANGALPPVFGDTSARMVVISNWSKAKFYEIDFSAAIIKAGIEEEGRKGKPSHIFVQGFNNKFSTRNAGPIYGKDGEGAYWLTSTLRDEAWGRIEENLRLLPF
ncbi:hypothetical protein BGZ60DRAFT_384179 [Tricladium varicosporioides]|nr:hypothetical protein BGZ60DRAFT_384179 [Hymenoscyphus varicosporioides]